MKAAFFFITVNRLHTFSTLLETASKDNEGITWVNKLTVQGMGRGPQQEDYCMLEAGMRRQGNWDLRLILLVCALPAACQSADLAESWTGLGRRGACVQGAGSEVQGSKEATGWMPACPWTPSPPGAVTGLLNLHFFLLHNSLGFPGLQLPRKKHRMPN